MLCLVLATKALLTGYLNMNDSLLRGAVTDEAWTKSYRRNDTNLDPLAASVLGRLDSTDPVLSRIHD